jgi:transcriptional regulator with XRE-family HTH domain
MRKSFAESPIPMPETQSAFHPHAQRNAFRRRRCASAIQIVRPLASTAETQPQLQPVLLRLSAMISQYFGKSQQQFARMFGVSASYIQAIELGQRNISNELADAIMLQLGIDAESLKRRRSMLRSLVESGRAELMLWRGPSSERAEMYPLFDEYTKLKKIADPNERLRRSILFWQKITPHWDWYIARRALDDKLALLFEAATREKKHFPLAMRLSRWIENSVSDFRLRTTIDAVRATRKTDWPPFMETLSESFRLLPRHEKQRRRRRRKR